MRAHLIAGATTALAVPAAAYGIHWIFPAGCSVRGDPDTYRWTCLLPALLRFTAPVIAALLVLAAWLFGLPRRFIETRPVLTTLITGLAVHLALSVGYSLTLDPAYRMQFFEELMSIPQPFLSGALPAAAYVAVLRWRAATSQAWVFPRTFQSARAA